MFWNPMVAASHWSAVPKARGAYDAGEADRDEHEVGAAEVERETADEPAGEAGRRDRARERQPEGPLEPEREQRGGVGADAEEGGVAERELTGVTEEEGQGQRQDAEDQ